MQVAESEIEMKNFTNPGLLESGFEKPGPGVCLPVKKKNPLEVRSLFHSLAEMQRFLEFVNRLGYEEEPDYNFIRKLFADGLKKQGVKDDGKSVTFVADQPEQATSPVSARGVSAFSPNYFSAGR